MAVGEQGVKSPFLSGVLGVWTGAEPLDASTIDQVLMVDSDARQVGASASGQSLGDACAPWGAAAPDQVRSFLTHFANRRAPRLNGECAEGTGSGREDTHSVFLLR